MEKVLIVSGSRQIAETLSGFISQAGEYSIDTVSTGATAAELAAAGHFRAIIVCPPLPEESACAVACRIAQSAGTIVILIVKEAVSETAAQQFEKAGVIALPKPVTKPVFMQAFRLVCTLQSRFTGLANENDRLRNKIDEIKLVDRAKCALIQYLGMTEQMAHRYIEKQAMDMRLPKAVVAEDILKTYES